MQMQSGVTGINSLRIYNPVKQSMEHDPDGRFIRQWVPELRGVSGVWIHQPQAMDAALQGASGCIIGEDYAAPLVDHGPAVRLARERVAVIRKGDGFRDAAAKVYQQLGSRRRPSRRPAKPRAETKEPQAQLRLI